MATGDGDDAMALTAFSSTSHVDYRMSKDEGREGKGGGDN
jgi:hypothetical protein